MNQRVFVLTSISMFALALLASPMNAKADNAPHAMNHHKHMACKGMHDKMSANHAMNGADEAYMQANMRMHREMNVPMTGNADVDFVRGMIPHHQGAIDMAQIELEYGRDPQIRQMAHDIIDVQQKEINWMQAWLDTKNAEPPNPRRR